MPVLVPEDAKLPLQYLTEKKVRKNGGVKLDNPYIFANTGTVYFFK